MEISRELFDQQRRPRFGNANPERMRLAFWEWMIRGKSLQGPYHPRVLFQLPMNPDDGPIWTFDRMGATRSELPDGRIVCIGGEHEDSYDPDFCIYNDVIVFDPTGQIEIYGYPKDVFPPTDFHTATLVGNQIVIIGCIGYADARCPGSTPVYALDLVEYRMSEIKTSGEMPGWIFKHEADFDLGVITLRGGEVIEQRGSERLFRRNIEDYALDTKSWIWHRLTSRNWRQFSIYQEDKAPFVLKQRPRLKALLPSTVEHVVVPCEEWNRIRIVVAGVPVSVVIKLGHIEVSVEGELSEEISARLAENIRTNTEVAIKRRCVLKRI